MSEFSAIDHAMMARALRLAERGAYTCRPNPMVGCVVVKGEKILGEGFHAYAGQSHAEVFALNQAGEVALGATAYVTLEPCAHHGRTPPCADALIAAGVSRVVVAMQDPFPQVAGLGLAKLRAAGIEVQTGLMQQQAIDLNKGFLSRVQRQRPWVRVKLAASLDGRTAMRSGESQWITGAAARQDVQHWRAKAGAILVGAGTVLADNPSLTVRLENDSAFIPPLRVILDTQLRSIGCERVRQGDALTLYMHSPNIEPDKAVSGNYEAVPLTLGRLDLMAVFSQLAARDINEVQVEAGAILSGALLRAGLVDEILLYTAPVLLGDTAKPLFAGLGIEAMAQKLQMQVIDHRMLGQDQRSLLQVI